MIPLSPSNLGILKASIGWGYNHLGGLASMGISPGAFHHLQSRVDRGLVIGPQHASDAFRIVHLAEPHLENTSREATDLMAKLVAIASPDAILNPARRFNTSELFMNCFKQRLRDAMAAVDSILDGTVVETHEHEQPNIWEQSLSMLPAEPGDVSRNYMASQS